MKISLNIVESNKQIEALILNSLIPDVNDYLKKCLSEVRKDLPPLLVQGIINSPEYSSLIGGQLKYEFGIPDPQTSINEILQIWTTNISIDYKPAIISAGKIKASFSIGLVKSNFDDVLSNDSGMVIDALRGYSLPWLEWLLLEGNKTIVKKQEVIVGPNKNSRTGFAVMRQSNQSWKVPSQFAGTARDNWITRAIDSIEADINNLLQRILSQ